MKYLPKFSKFNMADNMAEEEVDLTETEEKIEYPLEVQYCGGN